MARPRDPRRDEAKKLWLDSGKEMKLVEIAEQLGVTASTIRKWKSQDDWEENLKRSAPKSNRSAPLRMGAPKGNKNAVGNKGGGAPKGNSNAKGNRGGSPAPGNKNAVTTGEYESIMWDYLDDDERELFGVIETDAIFQLDMTIRELTIRQRRMMRRIQTIEKGMTERGRKILQQVKPVKDVHSVIDQKTGQSKTISMMRDKLVTVEVTETEYRKIEDILSIEEALTRITDKLLKALKQKHDMEKSYGEQPLKEELLLVNIEKARAEISHIKGEEEEYEDDGFLEAIGSKTSEVWSVPND